MSTTQPIDEISHWILSEGKKSNSSSDLLTAICERLVEHGIPVNRATMGAPLLHPIAQSNFAYWSDKEGGTENWFVWTQENLELLRNSPIYLAYENGEGVRLDLRRKEDRDRFGVGVDLYKEGYQAYTTIPLQFSDSSFKILTVATKTTEGFSDAHHEILSALALPISLVLELLVQQNTARTLVNTYIGTRAGKQVLDGDIHRGDGASINAVIWFSDLRGFTTLGNTLGEAELLGVLNRYFETVSTAISDHNGEVLKFIGDAVLGIFPILDDEKSAAADAYGAALQALGARSRDDWPEGADFGLALHVGEVFFGNVGGIDRLDFTVIGPQVNQTSRIEGLCSTLDTALLVSDEFNQLIDNQLHSKGVHSLKGFDQPVELFSIE